MERPFEQVVGGDIEFRWRSVEFDEKGNHAGRVVSVRLVCEVEVRNRTFLALRPLWAWRAVGFAEAKIASHGDRAGSMRRQFHRTHCARRDACLGVNLHSRTRGSVRRSSRAASEQQASHE